MTGVRWLQRFLSRQRQLPENAAFRQHGKAVCELDKVHLLAPLGVVKGSVTDSFSEGGAASARCAPDQKSVPDADHTRRLADYTQSLADYTKRLADYTRSLADWPTCRAPIGSNSAIQLWRPKLFRDLHSGACERQSKVNACVRAGFESSPPTSAQLDATASIATSSHSGNPNAYSFTFSARQCAVHAPDCSPPHKHPLIASSRSHSIKKSRVFSIGGTRAFATEGAAETADGFVKHLNIDESNHPTNASLKRAQGEPEQPKLPAFWCAPELSPKEKKKFAGMSKQWCTKGNSNFLVGERLHADLFLSLCFIYTPYFGLKARCFLQLVQPTFSPFCNHDRLRLVNAEPPYELLNQRGYPFGFYRLTGFYEQLFF